MALTDSVENVEGVMNHSGWFSQESAEYYGRKHSLVDSTIVASKLANSVGLALCFQATYQQIIPC
jgi:hypothetical protein